MIYDTHATLSGTYIAPSHYHLIKVTATNAHGTSPDSDIISISTASGTFDNFYILYFYLFFIIAFILFLTRWFSLFYSL